MIFICEKCYINKIYILKQIQQLFSRVCILRLIELLTSHTAICICHLCDTTHQLSFVLYSLQIGHCIFVPPKYLPQPDIKKYIWTNALAAQSGIVFPHKVFIFVNKWSCYLGVSQSKQWTKLVAWWWRRRKSILSPKTNIYQIPHCCSDIHTKPSSYGPSLVKTVELLSQEHCGLG